jgi:hypothetical protein
MTQRFGRPEFFPPRNARNFLVFAAFASAVFCYLLLFRLALIDDAFITLRYVKTLLASGTWGFYPGHTSNTATSPLNVLLLTLFSLATRSPVDSVLWLSTIELLVLALFLRAIGWVLQLELFAPLAFVSLIANPLFISTLGLESILFATLIVAALSFFLVERFELMAVACGLLTLTRPDGILFFVVCIVAMRGGIRERVRVLAVYALCLAPWYLFSWIELGSIVPDTLIIKLHQDWGHRFGTGLYMYLTRLPLETSLAFLPAITALLALRKRVPALGSFVYVVMAYGALYYASYSAIGAPPYHWYYTPVVLCIVLLGAFAVAQLARDSTMLRWGGLHPVAVAAFTLPIAGAGALFVREGVPLGAAWINSNWATQAEYESVGDWLRTHDAGQTGISVGEIGTIAYYCDCFLRDEFSDRAWLDRTDRAQEERRRLSRAGISDQLLVLPAADAVRPIELHSELH